MIGLVNIGGAATLAALFDRQIDDTVTPMAVGFLVYGALSATAVRWAGRTLTARVPAVS